MLKSMRFQKFSLLLAALLLVLSFVSADVLVSIGPRDFGEEVRTLYLNEVAFYDITVFNDSTLQADRLSLKIVCDPSLALLEAGEESVMLVKTIDSIEAGEKVHIYVKAKVVGKEAESYNLGVHYGFNEFNHFSSTLIRVAESPVIVKAGLKKTALSLDEKNSLNFELKNTSDSPVNGIKVWVLETSAIDSESEDFFLETLAAGEACSDKELVFLPGSMSGDSEVVLVVEFFDELGKHSIEKNFSFKVQAQDNTLTYLLIVLVVLIVLSFLAKGRKKKEKPKFEAPAVRETEPEEKENKTEKGSQQ